MRTEKISVLVVDDNKDAADSLALLLGLMGYRSHTAYDGVSALQIATQEEPDAMVIDIALPGMNGVELAKAIRGLAIGEQMSLIALTGYNTISDTVYPETKVFDQYLVKPVDKVALEKMCQTIDSKKKTR